MSLLPEKFYLDDFFEDFVPMPKMPKNEMKCDIYEKGGEVHIELDVPGFNKEDVKVDLDDGILTIAASKKRITIVKKDLSVHSRDNLMLVMLKKTILMLSSITEY